MRETEKVEAMHVKLEKYLFQLEKLSFQRHRKYLHWSHVRPKKTISIWIVYKPPN